MKGTCFDLSGRVALVTGGSKGLGKAMARGFAQAGADVVISSRHVEDLPGALAEIREGTSVRGAYFAADMTQRESVSELARASLEEMGRVDILVNNAGSNVPEVIDEIKDESWDCIVELNLTSCMALTRELVPQMKERKWGRIIHISSIMALGAKVARSVYCATKSALVGMGQASALDLGPFGITVNCIAPGPFLTDLPRSLLSKEDIKATADRTALGRWGDPEELAGAALLLASDAGSYITGETLVVDGGVMAKTL